MVRLNPFRDPLASCSSQALLPILLRTSTAVPFDSASMSNDVELRMLNRNIPASYPGYVAEDASGNQRHSSQDDRPRAESKAGDSKRSSGDFGVKGDDDSAATQREGYEDKLMGKRREDIEGYEEGEDDDNPVIRTGGDVSRYLVRFDDAGDLALTLRGFVLGNIFLVISCAVTNVSKGNCGTFLDVLVIPLCVVDQNDPTKLLFFASTACQIYTLKPLSLQLSSVFIQLAIWLLGLGCARFLPGPGLVEHRPHLKW